MIALRKPIPVSRKKGVPAPFALTVIVVETLLGAEIVIDTEYIEGQTFTINRMNTTIDLPMLLQ